VGRGCAGCREEKIAIMIRVQDAGMS
jgi:hypothetical protein